MKIIWTDFASNSLFEIYKYYKEVANENVAQRIKFRIFRATKQLIKNPLSGQVETNLQKLQEDHRYLIEGNYKIIYKRIKEGILITDVFDTRQDPIKIFKSITKPSS
jgi:plasmid stabilization system protein ParE